MREDGNQTLIRCKKEKGEKTNEKAMTRLEEDEKERLHNRHPNVSPDEWDEIYKDILTIVCRHAKQHCHALQSKCKHQKQKYGGVGDDIGVFSGTNRKKTSTRKKKSTKRNKDESIRSLLSPRLDRNVLETLDIKEAKVIDESFHEGQRELKQALKSMKHQLSIEAKTKDKRVSKRTADQRLESIEGLVNNILFVFQQKMTMDLPAHQAIGTETLTQDQIEKLKDAAAREYLETRPKHWIRGAIETVVESLRWVAGKAWVALRASWSLLKTIFPTAVSLAAWITSNPKTAQLTLIVVQILRNHLCQELVRWWMGQPQEASGWNPFHQGSSQSINALTIGAAVAGPAMEHALVSERVVDKVWDKAGTLLSSTVKSIPFVGGLASGIVEIVASNLKESTDEVLKFYRHYGTIYKSYTLLLDIFNPMMCLHAMEERRKTIFERLREQTQKTEKS